MADAVRDADVIITATWSKEPFLTRSMVRDGVHITAVGADEPAKGEVDAGLITSSLFVCDDRDLAASMGAIAGAGLGPDAIHAELGEVIAGVKPGRTRDDQITIFGTRRPRIPGSRRGVAGLQSRKGARSRNAVRVVILSAAKDLAVSSRGEILRSAQDDKLDLTRRHGHREHHRAEQPERRRDHERQLRPNAP